MTPVIRPAAPEDAAPLARLKLATFRDTFVDDGFRIPYPPADLALFEDETYSAPRVAAELADPAHRTWVAESEGRLVGYVHVGPCKLPHDEVKPGEAEIYQLYVDRAGQRSGLGRSLFEAALDWLGAAHPGRLWLGVWSGNEKAQRFYERYGFANVGGYLFPVGAWTDREYIYRRD